MLFIAFLGVLNISIDQPVPAKGHLRRKHFIMLIPSVLCAWAGRGKPENLNIIQPEVKMMTDDAQLVSVQFAFQETRPAGGILL